MDEHSRTASAAVLQAMSLGEAERPPEAPGPGDSSVRRGRVDAKRSTALDLAIRYLLLRRLARRSAGWRGAGWRGAGRRGGRARGRR